MNDTKFPDPKYAKLRAAVRWMFESLMVCMLACSAMMLTIQAVNQFVPGIVIPDRRKPVAYTLSLPEEICDETGRLQVSMAEFVRLTPYRQSSSPRAIRTC